MSELVKGQARDSELSKLRKKKARGFVTKKDMDPLTSSEGDAQGRGYIPTPFQEDLHAPMEDVGMSTDDEVSSHPDLGAGPTEPSEPSLERPVVKVLPLLVKFSR